MSSVSPAISVIICTLDRLDHVRMAVSSLEHQTIAQSEFEVIVVDNGTGSVAEALAGVAATMSNLRVVHEPVMGLSHARNRGTREALADVLLFMDDDAVAEPGLLEAHLRQLASPPRPVATGGRIYLRWPEARPTWVPASLETYYSGLDLGDTARPLRFPEYPYGANMAIRRETLMQLGGFSVALGRRGRDLISGEEKDLFLRVSRCGGRVDYVPDAVVHHYVLPERTRRMWFLRRSWAQGRSDIAMGLIANGPMPTRRLLARAGLHAWRGAVNAVGMLVPALPSRRAPGRRMRRASQMLRWLGAAREGVALARSSGDAVAR